MYTPIEVQAALDSMTILVDTREQNTPALRARLETLDCPWERAKLDYGDYACRCTLPDGTSYQPPVAVERKMSLDELCQCFGRDRARFEREFERAFSAGIHLHLLVEGGNWEKVLLGRYQSRLAPQALRASILAWGARYGMQVEFCKREHTGIMLYNILRYELKEILERGRTAWQPSTGKEVGR